MSDATVTIRPAESADAESIASVHADAWVETYPGMLPSRLLARMAASRRSKALRSGGGYGTLVVEDPGVGVVGYSEFGPQRGTALPYDGECFTLYLLQSHQRRGLGTHLLTAVRQSLAQAGLPRTLLWVLADNIAARAFYRHVGGAIIAERRGSWGGMPLVEIGYGWPAP